MHKSLKQAFLIIGITFLALFLATFITVRIALAGHTPPVDSNYYEKGLKYDQTVATQKAMLSEGYDFNAIFVKIGQANDYRKVHSGKRNCFGSRVTIQA